LVGGFGEFSREVSGARGLERSAGVAANPPAQSRSQIPRV
jgi:hypothetical protein